MEATSYLLSFTTPKHLLRHPSNFSSTSSLASLRHHPLRIGFHSKPHKDLAFTSSSRPSLLLPPALAVAEALEQAVDTDGHPRTDPNKTDRSGRFCSPRAARELALLIAYAVCLEGSDPVRLFGKRVNAKRELGYVFDKTVLLQYDHMSFGGAPIEVGTEEEAEELMLKNDTDSANEAEVLSAPPKLVYNMFVLRFARDLLAAVDWRWNQHVILIDKIIP